ncbi:hypothetical protein IWW39_001346 [Coemansia spiralis]|uniref:Uncharacterized protein n=1 Tax=Coemansia spiralis TaxID=417178 RepID=A0A9W8GNC7_9FUNG|nr:hypothetical protein IWW39_001346 [Coemansia spiralis]
MSLQLCAVAFCDKGDLDLFNFHFLHTLSIRVTLDDRPRKVTCANTGLSSTLPTVTQSLRHLKLAMNTSKNSRLLFAAPPFANSLSSLMLEGEYGLQDVEHMLRLFPNLQELGACAIVSKPTFFVPDLIDRYRSTATNHSLKPLNSLLRVLSAHGQCYFTGVGDLVCVSKTKRLMAPELNPYRGMLVDFVCRLPVLEAL